MKEIDEILKSGILSGFRATPDYHLGGKHVQALESAFCEYFGVRYAIALNSATAALHSALIACGVGSGDEVIVSPYSFSSSASCVLMVGAKPVFADIEDGAFCMDLASAERRITEKTKAIIPVHLCGHPTLMPLARLGALYDLKIIEDAAQAISATYEGQYVGTIGDCGIFSFNQSKHINTGEGGMLITDDDQIAETVRAVRNHGEVSMPDLKILGYNYRMCEIEAAIALKQFHKLDEDINYRIELANYLTSKLHKIDGIIPPFVYLDCRHVYYTYAVRITTEIDKQLVCDRLGEMGIYFGGYVKPLHLLPIYEQFGYHRGQCPVAERMWRRELIVTDRIKFPATFKDMDKIAGAFKEVII